NAPQVTVRNEERGLQKALDALFANSSSGDPMTDAKGRPMACLTKHLLDLLKQLDNKPVDYSGRGVVIPDVRLQLDTVGLPEFMVRELFMAVALRSLIKRGHAGTVSEAQKLLKRCPDSPDVKTALADGVACRSVLVLTANRKPAVFRPVLVDGEAIHLHPVA